MPFVKWSAIEDIKFNESQFLKTGIATFDKAVLGLGLGQLVIITGVRAGGKTTFIGNLVCNFSQQGYKGLICNFEMANPRTKKWIRLQALGKNNLKSEKSLSGKDIYFPKNDYVKNKVDSWIDEYVEVYDNSDFRLDKVSADIKERLEKNPDIKYIILDNLTKLQNEKLDENKYEAQSLLVKRLQVFAQKNNVCLILVAHPNKTKSLVRLEDIGGSGDIANMADLIILIHRITEDFKIRAKEYFNWKADDLMFNFNNIIEIAKDREFGEDGTMVGVYFEPHAKRFLNYMTENVTYNWENDDDEKPW